MIWAAICWQSTGPMISLHGQINSRYYLEVLSNKVHLMVQVMFPERNAIFQDDNAQYTQQKSLKNGMKSILMKLNTSSGLHNLQTSTSLSIYCLF